MSPSHPTIYALSSGRLPAAIAVIRISGPRAGDALKALGGKIPEPRKAAFVRMRDPATGEMIDEALALWFPAPHSETGEDTAELQPHGGRAVVAAIFRVLASIEGLRPAEAGEFTRRAFENGKLDLTSVEGLAELVGAETEAQRRQAFRQMKGVLGKRADAWRKKLIEALALIEAGIDFSDQEDVPPDLLKPAVAIARELEAEISDALADGRRGERLREGLVVAIAGPPNAGKSTLLNRLARREAAIVSPYAGTTRDVIEVHLDLNGLPVTLLDTAGIRETDDPVEIEGVRRARERAAAADLVLWVVDASDDHGAGRAVSRPTTERSSPGSMAERVWPGLMSAAVSGANASEPPPVWLIRNKADLLPEAYPSNLPGSSPLAPVSPAAAASSASASGTSAPATFTPVAPTSPASSLRGSSALLTQGSGQHERNESIIQNIEHSFILSSKSGLGVDELVSALTSAADQLLGAAEPALVTRERHRLSLKDAQSALRRILTGSLAEDLLAEELRLAARALERLTGRVDVEDVLDVIFRDFCIGK